MLPPLDRMITGGRFFVGYFLVIAASVLFGIFPSLQTYVLNTGTEPLALVVVCNGTACVTAGFIGVFTRQSFRVGGKTLFWLILTGVGGLFFTDFLLDMAYTLIPVGFATMIHFMYPALVCLAMAVFFKEKLTRTKTGAILLSVAGLALISGGDFSGSVTGILCALGTAAAYAFYMISNAREPVSNVPQMSRSFYLNLFGVITALIVIASRGGAVYPAAPGPLLVGIFAGTLLSIGIILLNMGIERLGPDTASFINMVEPVTSVVVSFLVFHYAIGTSALFGCALILSSLFLVALSGRRNSSAPPGSMAGGSDHTRPGPN